MKVLRSIASFILSFILFVDIFIISSIICFNNLIKKELVPEIIKQVLIDQVAKNVGDNQDLIREKFNGISDFEGIDDLLELTYREVLDCKKNNREVSDEAIDELVDIIVRNKGFFDVMFDGQIDMEKFKTEENKQALKKTVNENIEKINLPSDSPAFTVIDTYSVITDLENIFKFVALAIVLIVLIGVVNWSYYKWIRSLSIPLIFSGVNLIVTYILFLLMLNFLKSSYGITLSVNFSPLIYQLIIETVLGIILLVIYNIINKKNKVSEL